MMTINNEKNKIKKLNIKSKITKNIFKIKNHDKKKIRKKHKKLKKFKGKINKSKKNHDNSNVILEESQKNLKNEKTAIEEKFGILNDFELNVLNYEETLINDKRNFIQLYISLIKTKHPLIFSFCQLKDYNSQMIKIFIFFLTFSMNLTVSAMFYSDSTMHKIYVEYVKFDFIYQLPQMIYSFIISSILENLLSMLGLYEQDIIEIKKSIVKKGKILKKIMIKIILFFIIVNILLFLFWIYLGCFCAVYRNTQIHLLMDVLYSFTISCITPFFIVFLSCIFHIISFKDKKGKNPMLFKFSNFLLNF